MIVCWKRLPLILLVVITFGLLFWGWHYLMKPTTLPFKKIQVSNAVQYIDTKQIAALASNHLEGGFFSLNVSKLKTALLKEPWIMKVAIRREWPSTLDLVITERHPEARWGKMGVISDRGVVFYPKLVSIPKNLPEIIAPAGSEKEVLDNFQKLRKSIEILGLNLTCVVVTIRMEYRVTLSNGVNVMLGHDDMLARFQRFVDLYPKVIGDRSARVLRVDLRYPNGLAVEWKSMSSNPTHSRTKYR